jgi:hypothetical protein
MGQALLQLEQLDAWQEEQPEDMVCELPSVERETPLKLEKRRSIFSDWQSGHSMPLSDDPKTNFSNSDSHCKHLYSKIGMTYYAPKS